MCDGQALLREELVRPYLILAYNKLATCKLQYNWMHADNCIGKHPKIHLDAVTESDFYLFSGS